MKNINSLKVKGGARVRMAYVIIIILLDAIFLPTVPHVVDVMIRGQPPDYQYIEYFLTVFEERNLYLFLLLQMPVLALCLAIGWNTRKIKADIAMNADFGTPEAAGNGQHGTARWQTETERDKSCRVWRTDKPLAKGGIVFGMEQQGLAHKVWLEDEDAHTLIIGATRSGKSRRLILPSIWELAQAGESMLLGDPKGELYITTHQYLQRQGYHVVSINLREPLKGNRWNLLDTVNQYIDARETSKAEEAAWDIANAIVNQKPYNGDPIWQNGEESLIASLILLVCMNSDFKFQRHIASVYYLLVEYGQPMPDNSVPLNDYIQKLDTLHPAKGAYAPVALAHPEARASFFISALADLRIFSDSNVMEMTAASDHVLSDIATKKTAVFLIVPDEKSTRNVMATLYIDQVYTELVKLANQRGGRIPIRVNTILDEFGNLPTIPGFAAKLTVAGGRGIRFSIAVQDIGQIKKYYEKEYSTILGNCHNLIYLITADYETAEMISKRAGNYTVETEGLSTSVGDKNSNFGASANMTGRALLMPDEILRWEQGRSLVLRVRKYPSYYKMPDLSAWQANRDFGLEGVPELDRAAIQEREQRIIARESVRVELWQPDMQELVGETSRRNKNVLDDLLNK